MCKEARCGNSYVRPLHGDGQVLCCCGPAQAGTNSQPCKVANYSCPANLDNLVTCNETRLVNDAQVFSAQEFLLNIESYEGNA